MGQGFLLGFGCNVQSRDAVSYGHKEKGGRAARTRLPNVDARRSRDGALV